MVTLSIGVLSSVRKVFTSGKWILSCQLRVYSTVFHYYLLGKVNLDSLLSFLFECLCLLFVVVTEVHCGC